MLESDFMLVARTYQCSRVSQVRSYMVNHVGFRKLSAQLGRLISQLDVVDDPYWISLMRYARRLRFELAALPVPFNAPELECVHLQAEVDAQYARCAVLYPQLASTVNLVLDTAREVLVSADAPLLAGLADAVADSPTADSAIVLCESRLIRTAEPYLRAHPTLRQCEVLGPAQLRALQCYDRLLCIGSARWFPSYVTEASRAPEVDFIHFRWTPGPSRPRPLFAIPWAEETESEPDQTADQESPSIFSSSGLLAIDEGEPIWLESDTISVSGQSLLQELVHRANSANAAGDRRQDIVRALPVALDGGRAVFLDAEEGATVLVLDLAERGKSRVRRLLTPDVEVGMFVLLRASGGGDYVLPVANTVLGRRATECRRVQRDWKVRLRAYVDQHGLFETSVALLEHGSTRAEEGNVRRWMWDRNIRPRDYADFLAIMRLIGLESEARQYWSAMELIERAHIKAGQLIRSMLLAQVMHANLAELERVGTMEFDLPGTGSGKMVACRVVRLAREAVMVGATHVAQLLSAGLAPWR